MGFLDRLQHAYNAFRGREPTRYDYGRGSMLRPDRIKARHFNDRSMVTAILNRIAVDAAQIDLEHVRLDENQHYVGTIQSGLNYCLTVEANKDQTGRAFRQDAVMSLMDEGVIAIVPTGASHSPRVTSNYRITDMRVGKVVEWFPDFVKVNLYNDQTGLREDVIFPKAITAIVENPFYSVMNEPNSTIQRLIHKMALMDSIDEQVGVGKLDMIIQLPYIIKTEARRQQAEQRRKDIEMQLSGSKYGIAYTDGTEHITQLNRSLENNLLSQIEYLMNTLYGQLGITKDVFEGTADEKTMLNYYNRTIEPILSAITDELSRKFLTKTARSQGQAVKFFRDPFKLTPVDQLADLADKMTRNEIMSSNEFRAILGYKPADGARADELSNKNMPSADFDTEAPMTTGAEEAPMEGMPAEEGYPEEEAPMEEGYPEEEAPMEEEPAEEDEGPNWYDELDELDEDEEE